MGDTSILVGADLRSRLLGMTLVNISMAILLLMLYVGCVSILAWFGVRDQATAHMLASVGLAVSVIPLRRRLVVLSNRVLHLRWQDSDEILREFSTALSQTIEPAVIGKLLVEELPRRVRLRGATLWMLEPPDDLVFSAFGTAARGSSSSLLIQGHSVATISSCGDYIHIPGHSDAEWARPFSEHGVGLAIPLRAGNRLVGIYGCGWPVKRRAYPYRTVHLLIMLAPAIASALENARAYTNIARLNQQLRALDKLKDQFIEHVGHELRTPVTSLSLSLQLLMREPQLMSELGHVIRGSMAQLEVLVNRVLLMDHYLEDRSIETPSTATVIELLPLLEDLASVFLPAAQAKGLSILAHAPEGLAAWGEIAGLRRALHELLDNAVRYSERGAIALNAMARDGLVVITVTDQGPGIPLDERDLLFESFYRGRGMRALAEKPGVGLGLSLARRDIEALGGKIWLDRADGAGSTMSIALPAAKLSIEEYGRATGKANDTANV